MSRIGTLFQQWMHRRERPARRVHRPAYKALYEDALIELGETRQALQDAEAFRRFADERHPELRGEFEGHQLAAIGDIPLGE